MWRSSRGQKPILLLTFSTREFQLFERVVLVLQYYRQRSYPLCHHSLPKAPFLSSNMKTKQGRDPRDGRREDNPASSPRRLHGWLSTSVSFPSSCLELRLRSWSSIENKERLLTIFLQLPDGHERRCQQNHGKPGDGQLLVIHLYGEAGGRGGGKEETGKQGRECQSLSN